VVAKAVGELEVLLDGVVLRGITRGVSRMTARKKQASQINNTLHWMRFMKALSVI
jgi:hypothetical protein